MAPKKAMKGKGKGRKARRGAPKGKRSQNTKVNANLKVSVNATLQIGNAGQNVVTNYTLGYVTPLGPFGSNASSFFSNRDFIAQKALYDEVCIRSFKVTYTPVVNTVNLYDQGFVVPATNQVTLQPNLYTWFDRDSTPMTAVSASMPQVLAQYDSYKRHDCRKKWSRTIKLKPIWLACDGVAAASHVSEAATIPLTQAGLLGALGIYGQNLPWGGSISSSNEAFGQIQTTWSFSFRGKRSLNTQVDANGIITLTPASLYAPIAPTMLYAELNDVDGIPLSLDASGNPVYVVPGPPTTTTTTTA